MDARAESQDLKTNPLPLVLPAGVRETELLTHYLNLQDEIDTLEKRIEDLTRDLQQQVLDKQEEMATVLQYALEHNIHEDLGARIEEIPGRKTRTLNIPRFREVFPDEYAIACTIERKEKMEALDHIGEKINLTLVDRLVKKVALAASQGVVTVTVGPSTITVVPK